MIETDEAILAWMETGLAITRSFLAKMPLYVERGHHPPAKLTALKRAMFIEARVVMAYRQGTSKGLTPEDKVWAAYLYGWACAQIKQRGNPGSNDDALRGEFQRLWDVRDAGLVALGLPAYGENFGKGESTDAPLRVPTKDVPT